MVKLSIKRFLSGYSEVYAVCEKCGHAATLKAYKKPSCPKCGHHKLRVTKRTGKGRS